jgi:hypothetical protein
VNVGRHDRRIVERPGADKPDSRARVLAVQRDLARRTTPDLLLLAATPRNVNRDGLACEQLDPICLDQYVDDECASGLPLTVEAVAAVDEERIGCQAVADLAAGATTLE